jgi:hypothetical protein
MNSEYEKRLENEIHGELKKLPELIAPRTLISRVMAAIEARLRLPWYRQSWQVWPLALRAVSLVILLALFGGLCFGAWKLSQAEAVAAAMQRPLGLLSGLGAIFHAISVVLTALILAVKQLGAGILIGCLAALALGYAMCVGLGTVYLRLGLARR